ncbi:hypothetical protein [Rhodococcus sp. ACPA4]|uniref:hypothetical protein n=1 Tax=Rhodococcus sp. ACPA4 TaxID=2028571 RepID=UPI00117A04B1|nr:hypothetical protein [Rhodococcus sp. ACPA4]
MTVAHSVDGAELLDPHRDREGGLSECMSGVRYRTSIPATTDVPKRFELSGRAEKPRVDAAGSVALSVE